MPPSASNSKSHSYLMALAFCSASVQLQNKSRHQKFSHQQCPRCKVKRCSSCLFGKQMRQTSAAAAIKQFINLERYCCTCTALRVLRYATQFVTLLAAHTAFVTAAPVSFMPPHSFRSHSVHPLPIISLALRTTVCVTGLH